MSDTAPAGVRVRGCLVTPTCVSDPQKKGKEKPEHDYPFNYMRKMYFDRGLALPSRKPGRAHICGEKCQSRKQQTGFTLAQAMIARTEVANASTFPTANGKPELVVQSLFLIAHRSVKHPYIA